MFCFWLHIILNWYPFFIYVLISFEILFWRLGFSLIASKRHLKMLVMLMSWEMSLQCRWSLLLVSSGELWSSPVSYSWWGRGQAAAGDITPRIYIFTACHSAQPPSAAQRAGYRTTAPPPTTTIWTSTPFHNINLGTFCILSINSIVNQCKMFCCDLSKIEFNENQNR